MSNFLTPRVHVLAVTPFDSDLQALSRIFSHTAWDLSTAKNVSGALETMRITPVPIVLTATTLPDGSWRDVLAASSKQIHSPLVVVSSSAADDLLWAEALNLGAYDVLAKPFRPDEVFRVIGLAWRHWADTQRARPPVRAMHCAAR
jgi:DNA-binding NtrC family response regulator